MQWTQWEIRSCHVSQAPSITTILLLHMKLMPSKFSIRLRYAWAKVWKYSNISLLPSENYSPSLSLSTLFLLLTLCHSVKLMLLKYNFNVAYNCKPHFLCFVRSLMGSSFSSSFHRFVVYLNSCRVQICFKICLINWQIDLFKRYIFAAIHFAPSIAFQPHQKIL